MKKKQAVFTLVACSIAALVLTGVLIVGLRSDGFGWKRLREESVSGTRQEDGQYRYEYVWDPAETQVNGLNVEWVNGLVEIKPGNESVIKITESSGKELKENQKLQLSSSGGVLKIKWEKSLFTFSLFHNENKNLTVEVPRELAESLDEFSCSTASGSISAAGFTAKEINVSSASGDLNLSGLKGEEGNFSSTSGSVALEDLELSGELNASTTSGNLNFSGTKAEKVVLDTVSGDTFYSGSALRWEANSVSAAVRGELENCPEEADLDAVSGSLTLVIPENPGFDAEYSSISGSFSSDFPVTGDTGKSGRALYSSGKSKFSFSTTSGDMRILKQ